MNAALDAYISDKAAEQHLMISSAELSTRKSLKDGFFENGLAFGHVWQFHTVRYAKSNL